MADAQPQAQRTLGALHATSLSAIDPRTVLETLSIRALPHMSEADLAHIAWGARECAGQLAANAAIVADGLAFLVCSDDDNMGNFQSCSDVPPLLHHLGAAFNQIAGLLKLADDARNQQRKRGGLADAA